MQTDRQTSKCNYRCTVGLLQEGKLSLHSLTGYPTCEQALVYSTKALQNVSSSSALKTHQRNKSSLRKRPLCFFLLTGNNNKTTCVNNCIKRCFDSHAEVRHTAGHKRIGVNVFVAGQKWKEEQCTAFLYGILHTVKTVYVMHTTTG